MPVHEIKLSDIEQEVLEKIRMQQGLESVEQTAEWLVKTRLRKQVKQITGRGRSLYKIERKS